MYLYKVVQIFKGNYGGGIPTQPLFSPQRRQEMPQVARQSRRVRVPVGDQGVAGDPYHDFNYYNGKDGQTSVRIVMDNNRFVCLFNYSNFNYFIIK